MKKYVMETIGCRLNQYETEKIAVALNNYGFKRTDNGEEADLFIINTCTVTARADASNRSVISKAVRQNGKAPVVVIGCYVDAEPEKVARLNGVDLVLKNAEKEDAVEIIKRSYPELFDADVEYNGENLIEDFYRHNRAWVKIGDGCDQRCSYCIIPSVRGPVTNRPAGEIIAEIQNLSNHKYNEVVLTGVHIGKYKTPEVKSLAELVQAIFEKTDIFRIRLSSIEPQEITDRLIDTVKTARERVCRHLHVPLQSGSDRILKLMKRPYDSRKYLDTLEKIKNAIPGVVIGADIIVGFPGETERDFAESMRVADFGLIDYLHVFSYSDRPGTAASKMTGKVWPEEIKTRNRILRGISDRRHSEALKREVGKTVYAISESFAGINGGRYHGVTDNYLQVLLPKEAAGGKEVIKLTVTGTEKGYLVGE